jgi:hypothetical protein
MGDHTWECPCGAFVARLAGPPRFNFNCHCHSCVAPARYLYDKYPAGRSALVGGAVGKAFWLLEDIQLPADGLAFLKVGDAGENIRARPGLGVQGRGLHAAEDQLGLGRRGLAGGAADPRAVGPGGGIGKRKGGRGRGREHAR